MRRLKELVGLNVLVLLPWLAVSAAFAESDSEPAARSVVFGLWESAKGTIFYIDEKAGQLQATVVEMRSPHLDHKNPVEELRTRPVLGLQVLSGYKFRRGSWRGRIYDPGSGRSFKSYIKHDDDGTLRLRGYIGFALLGKTEKFQPVDDCSEQMAGMLDAIQLAGACGS